MASADVVRPAAEQNREYNAEGETDSEKRQAECHGKPERNGDGKKRADPTQDFRARDRRLHPPGMQQNHHEQKHPHQAGRGQTDCGKREREHHHPG